ncbi:hydantoinase B/oxoprolinase family protein [Cupriavidus numazuensis]|nr:hydantoinase B/oxoprolinase family protein [Cupriavidus numazuensis]
MTATIDPVTLTVIEKGLGQVCNEMDMVHEKTSFSPVISEAYDRSNGIYGLEDGRLIAQGALGLPIFVGVMQETTRCVIEECPNLGPGDIIIVNDPYRGGTHLMDVKMVQPFFYKGKRWCYLSNAGHWPDTGGMVPGGFSSTATEIHQEGLRIPPVKIVDAGTMNEDMVKLILANIRIPDERIGDIKAQIAALNKGAERLTALLDRYGAEEVSAAIEELQNRAERMMRAKIRSIPDGIYKGLAYMDSDGVVNEPLEIHVDMTVRGDQVYVSLARSSKPCAGPMNSVWASTVSAVYLAFKHVFPEVPINAGCFRPITVEQPKGTFLFAEYPRPVAGCAAEVSQRVMESMFTALAHAVPQRLFGAPAGTSGNLNISGVDPETGHPYVMYYFSGGGYGGWWDGDGISNGCSTIGISKSQPVEILEQRYPVRFEHYNLREGSGGAGKHRGGFGVNYRIRLLRGTAKVSFLMDHGKFGPPGILGGEPGATNQIVISQSGRESTPEHASKADDIALVAGDWIEVRTPGGGGYGDPSEREESDADRDRRNGYFDTEATRSA